jgi:hypothetical protein
METSELSKNITVHQFSTIAAVRLVRTEEVLGSMAVRAQIQVCYCFESRAERGSQNNNLS